MAYALFAQFATDSAEQALGFEATEGDREELRSWVPRVRVVEREG